MAKFTNIVIGFISPFLLLMSGFWLLQQPWDSLSHPRIAAAVAAIEQDMTVLLVGNSVTATLDSVSLAKEMQKPVQNVAMEGSLPAHWTALLAQARIRYRIKPQTVVLYVATNNLFRTRLTDEEDIVMLEQLSPEYVEGLSDRALGISSSYSYLQNRIPLQKRLLNRISRLPVEIFWPHAAGFIEQSTEEIFGGIKPQTEPRSPATPGRGNRPEETTNWMK